MSDEIPFAQPSNIDDDKVRQRQRRKLCKRKFVGSGVCLLKKDVSSSSKMSDLGKSILRSLMYQNGIEIDGEVESDYKKYGNGVGVLINNDDNTSISSSSSVFIAILKAAVGDDEKNTSPVTTKHVLSKVCLTLPSGNIPGNLDSKDVVLAALHFLSTKLIEVPAPITKTSSSSSSEKLSEVSEQEGRSGCDSLLRLFPILHIQRSYGDLERRVYFKDGDWKLTDRNFVKKVLQIETVFFHSSSLLWKWQKRESFNLSAITLSVLEKESLLMKGTIPSCATYKKAKNATTGFAGGSAGASATKKKLSTSASNLASLSKHEVGSVSASTTVNATPTKDSKNFGTKSSSNDVDDTMLDK